MLPEFNCVKDIAQWMDDKNCSLVQCYKGEIPGYSQEEFLADLNELASIILNKKLDSGPFSWNCISFSRCLKGLKGLSADSLAVQNILDAFAMKISQSKIAFGVQAIGNALYGFHNMDAHSNGMQKLLLALTSKIAQSTEMLSAQHIGN